MTTLKGFALPIVPTTDPSDPSAQAEELLEKCLIPMADILRLQGQGSDEGRVWRPEAIYLALLRAAVTVMGTEWAADPGGVAKLQQAWEAMLPPLRDELMSSYTTARHIIDPTTTN